MTRAALHRFGFCHPRFRGSEVPRKGVVLPSDGALLTFDTLEDSIIRTPRIRFTPLPTLILLHAIDALHKFPPLADALGERVALVLNASQSHLGIQGAFYRPVFESGDLGASPLLFPHTSEASAVGLAAVNFGLKGPCLVAEGETLEGTLQTANLLLRSGLVDLAIVAALNYHDPVLFGRSLESSRETSGLPEADCAAAVLLDAPWTRPAAMEAPEIDRAFGRTGACRGLINEAWRTHAAGPADQR